MVGSNQSYTKAVDAPTTELPRQLNGWVESRIKAIQRRSNLTRYRGRL